MTPDTRETRRLRSIARAAGELLDLLDDDLVHEHLDDADRIHLYHANSLVHEIARGGKFR